MTVIEPSKSEEVVETPIKGSKNPQSTLDPGVKPTALEEPKPDDLDSEVVHAEAQLSDEDDIVVYTSEDDTISLEDTGSKHSAEDSADADEPSNIPETRVVPSAPLPSLPASSSDRRSVSDTDTCSTSDTTSTLKPFSPNLGLSPPASPSISIAATAGDPEDMELTEEDVDAALAAEMAELKVEIAALRAKAPHIHVESEDEAESESTRKDKDKWEEEEDVLRMAEIKLAYVEENFRKL